MLDMEHRILTQEIRKMEEQKRSILGSLGSIVIAIKNYFYRIFQSKDKI